MPLDVNVCLVKNKNIPEITIKTPNTETDTIGSFKNNKMKIIINFRLSLVIDNVLKIVLMAPDVL